MNVESTASLAGTRAADAVVDALRSMIARGELADGSRLPSERELIERFGVSRTVVREAVAKLASLGFVESRPRFRPVIRRPGYEAALSAVGSVVTHLLQQSSGVKNLYDARVFLETGLVRQAALHARKADIEALRRALAENEAAIPDSRLFYTTDMAFHAVLYQIPRNPIFPAVHRAFTAWLSPHWERMPRSVDRNRVNYLRHSEIYTSIAERDPDAAEAALTAHLASAWEFVRGTFEDPDHPDTTVP